jgi:hypothetical protein
MLKKSGILAITALCVIHINIYSQGPAVSVNGQTSSYIPTAVPFLTIDPESRGGAMGDAGVATSPDVNSMHWNPAKYAFIQNDAGAAVSYSPWLRNLGINDIDLGYIAGYKHISKDQVICGSFRYFSLGQLTYTDNSGNNIRNANPNEFAIDAGYSRLFSEHFSGGVAFRYIESNLGQGTQVEGVNVVAGQSFAADISAYYTKDIKLGDKKGKLSYGIDISNMGSKMYYTADQKTKDFLPTNLRLGAAVSEDLDEYNSMTLTLDLNKLLVPTPPAYYITKSGQDSVDSYGNYVIQSGKNSNVSVLTGMIQSFYDAPGGLQEELQEITWSVGAEYWYRKQFALRTGYFHEAQSKGNRKYATFGVGLKLNVIGFDFSYLVANEANPLANTLRFTISLDFDALHKLKSS